MALTATRDGQLRLAAPVRLTAKHLKATVVLTASELVAATRGTLPDVRVPVQVAVGDRKLTASLNSKGVRKALAAITQHGLDGVAVILQGKLEGDTIAEAGLVVQPRAKPANAVGGRANAA